MRTLTLICSLGLSALGIHSQDLFAAGRYAYAPLDAREEIETWAKAAPGRFWVQGEGKILYADEEVLGVETSADDKQPIAEGHWQSLKGQSYFFYGAQALPEGATEILRGGRVRVVMGEGLLDLKLDPHGGLMPLQKNHVLVQQTSVQLKNQAQDSPFSLGQWIDADQWHEDVKTLSDWSRYSYGEGNVAARAWLEAKLQELPGFSVSEFPFKMPRGSGINVLGQITGKSRPEEIYIIGAHSDSTSEQPSGLTPGAEDNASGVAGLLAVARVFAEHPPEATLIFVGFSGEEQGLYGSLAWTKDWLARGAEKQIQAALIMDMIGYSGDDELDLLLETSTLTKPLLASINSVHTDPDLVVSESFNYWGSDHEPFLDNDIPAILFIENDYLDYPSYHRSSDTADKIHPSLGPKILRLMTDSLGQWVF